MTEEHYVQCSFEQLPLEFLQQMSLVADALTWHEGDGQIGQHTRQRMRGVHSSLKQSEHINLL